MASDGIFIPSARHGLHIVDSNEAQDLAEIRLDRIPWLPGSLTKDSAGCEHQDRLLAFRKPFDSGACVIERLASAHNMVNPRL